MKLTQLKNLALALSVFALASCASTPKAEISSTASPNDEVTRLHKDLAAAELNDFAVLDPEDLQKSRDHLQKAEDRLRDNKSQEDILNELRTARGYYELADKRAAARRSNVETILDVRNEAVDAGAAKFPQSRNELNDADKELRGLAEAGSPPAAEKVQKMQMRYSGLQMTALEISNLGTAKSMIENAKNRGAESKAPKTFNQAKVDYLTAKNMISSNRKNTAAYSAQVKQAVLSADTLDKVMEIASKDGSKFNEDDALKIVWQQRRIHGLDSDLATAEGRNKSLQSEVKDTKQELGKAQKAVNMQAALREAQDQFSTDEAEVYQQEDKLLIRLKSVGFASGSAQIPTKADELLDKVQTVVTGLAPSQVVVQGHTDSTGGKAVNEKLSQKRADSVAAYLEKGGLASEKVKTEGYGDAKPLSTNKTASGRAQNRRIDILVTPSQEM